MISGIGKFRVTLALPTHDDWSAWEEKVTGGDDNSKLSEHFQQETGGDRGEGWLLPDSI